jgi:hypothetical protein
VALDLDSLNYADALAVAIFATEQVIKLHDEAFNHLIANNPLLGSANPYPRLALAAAKTAVADPSTEHCAAAAASAEAVFDHWAHFGPSSAFEAGDAAAFTAMAASQPQDYRGQVENAIQAATNSYILNLDMGADWGDQKAIFHERLAYFLATRPQDFHLI